MKTFQCQVDGYPDVYLIEAETRNQAKYKLYLNYKEAYGSKIAFIKFLEWITQCREAGK